ncbi:MAG: enoyl-CoA hydratase/isomerase family protein [Desulfarculaceae bacterium]|nr:enoyl-CoA hydratase/isomerase family protein [Desulfarculaceae bacterium]MCF8073804.1 enoyl-CoA hydratase/isomerase family protein [Desulfarculaceae bacterium]MCF8102045.1 enoyl-CoA hydratase/isomerase family protein [Desulfarculaceae bacterium]MCF8116015.1 enoyl-CoA hydratase/isomerase family protein [Desulfarculaceae bacterium]
MASYETLLCQDRGPVRLITLNNPDTFNALDFTSGPELIGALEEAGRDPAIRVVVLTGAGKAFSAGANVRLMQQGLAEGKPPAPFFSELAAILHRSISTMRRLPKPVVCALNGVAAGGGMGWVLASDMVVASRAARLEPAYIKIGLTPDGGSTALLARALGPHRAAEFFMLGQGMNAQTAFEHGLFNQVVEPDQELDTALELAEGLAAGPATALAQTKALLNSSLYGDLEKVMEDERQSICAMSTGPEFLEGITAFFEKRKPSFD